MSDKSLQARTMRKTVERVDIGSFGIPMRVLGWSRKTKGSWGGWAAVTLGQAIVGALICLLAGHIFGVPANAFSLAVLAGFVVGSAIGGPISFSLWSALLILLTGLVAGFLGGAWVASPSWWKMISEAWARGSSIPFWFVIAVPLWMLFWIAAARGVAKVAEMLFEKFALRWGFRTAQRFTGEDKRVYDKAFEQSDISHAETRSLLESSGDGTHAVIAGEPSKIEGSLRSPAIKEMGGEPDMSPVPLPQGGGLDYSTILDLGTDDPDVLKAVGCQSSGLEDMNDAQDVVQPGGETPSAGVLIKMEPLDLPEVPRDQLAPLQRVEAPKLNPLQNRALSLRMSQLNLAFQVARREDTDHEFIQKHEEQLAIISDEERMILEAMKDAGALLALIHKIKQKRAEDFCAGRALLGVAPGTGALDGPVIGEEELDNDEADATDGPEDEAETSPELSSTEEGESSVRPEVAAMAAAFSEVLTTRRQRNASTSAATQDMSDQIDEDNDDASSELNDASKHVPDALVETTVPTDEAVDLEDQERSSGKEERESVPVFDSSNGDRPAVLIEELSRRVKEKARQRSEPANETPNKPFAYNFDVELQERAKASEESVATSGAGETNNSAEDSMGAEAGAVGNANVTDMSPEGEAAPSSERDGLPELEMTARVYNRSVCRQVLGLVVGPLDPNAKADDVLEFERDHPDIVVVDVLNSRSFDEHVGASEASAARHAYREIMQVRSQSSLDRLSADLERVNARGQTMIEEPQTLTEAAFNVFEAESSRLRRMATASGDNELLSGASPLLSRNVAILDALSECLRIRSEAAKRRDAPAAHGLVRQKVASGIEEETAARGRERIGSVLDGARKSGITVMRDARGAAGKPEESDELLLGNEVQNQASQPGTSDVGADIKTILEAGPVSEYVVPQLGEEGFESSHPVNSRDYRLDMIAHNAAQEARKAALLEEEAANNPFGSDAEGVADEGESPPSALESLPAEDGADGEQGGAAPSSDEGASDVDAEEITADFPPTGKEASMHTAEAKVMDFVGSRSLSEDLILGRFWYKEGKLPIPERFHTQEIITDMVMWSELRNVRFGLQGGMVGADVEGLSAEETVMRVPSVRAQHQLDIEMMNKAVSVLSRIASMFDVANPNEPEAILQFLDENEKPFFEHLRNQVNRGRKAQERLKLVEVAEQELREKAEKAGIATELESSLRQTSENLNKALSEVAEKEEAISLAENRAIKAEREKNEALELLASLKKEMAGIIDDDFQEILDKYADKVDTGVVDGLYRFFSPDKKDLLLVMTTPYVSFPDGYVQCGTKVKSFDDFLGFFVQQCSVLETDNAAVFYTDPKIRAWTNDEGGFILKQINRSVDDLKSVLGEYGIQIDMMGAAE